MNFQEYICNIPTNCQIGGPGFMFTDGGIVGEEIKDAANSGQVLDENGGIVDYNDESGDVQEKHCNQPYGTLLEGTRVNTTPNTKCIFCIPREKRKPWTLRLWMLPNCGYTHTAGPEDRKRLIEFINQLLLIDYRRHGLIDEENSSGLHPDQIDETVDCQGDFSCLTVESQVDPIYNISEKKWTAVLVIDEYSFSVL